MCTSPHACKQATKLHAAEERAAPHQHNVTCTHPAYPTPPQQNPPALHDPLHLVQNTSNQQPAKLRVCATSAR